MIELAPFQWDAVNRLGNGKILCGGVGSGKSRTALAYYYFKVCKHGSGYSDRMLFPRDLYIITTARKRDTLEWLDETVRFGISTDPELNEEPVKLTIDSWNNIQKYTGIVGAFFIFDEQRVVGNGKWVKSFYSITKRNKWILLSATPGDTWTDYIPVFIANGFYKNRTEFLNRHCVFSRYTSYPKIQRYLDVERLVRIRDILLVDMEFTRQTKSHHEYIQTEYDRKAYNRVFRDRWDIYKDEPCKNASQWCSILRRVVNTSDDRLEQTRVQIQAHPRLIIFYNFDYELELLRGLCSEVGTTCREWNGHKHEPIPKEASWVYLVQYSAGAEGWNCIETDTIVFYSGSYSYRATIQSCGRIDRFNTPFRDLYFIHLTSNSTIDRAIDKCIAQKKNFNESSWSGKISFPQV